MLRGESGRQPDSGQGRGGGSFKRASLLITIRLLTLLQSFLLLFLSFFLINNDKKSIKVHGWMWQIDLLRTHEEHKSGLSVSFLQSPPNPLVLVFRAVLEVLAVGELLF